MKNVYQKQGFKNRKDYLRELAAENGVHDEVVFSLADMLGLNEDFDGLVCAVEDLCL